MNKLMQWVNERMSVNQVMEDHLTKYCILLPGKTKTALETAEKLKFIFSILAAPVILQSDNGREFVNQV